MEVISSSQNQRIKKLVRLHSSRGRQQQNRIAVFGSREIIRAIRSGIEPDELFVCSQLVNADVMSAIGKLYPDFDSRAISVSEELFDKICFGDRSDGIVMTAQRPDMTLESIQAGLDSAAPVIAVAESIEKPGNLGAILRSVDGAGIDALIVANPVTDWFHPNTIRSSLGTCFSVRGCQCDTETVQGWLSEQGYQVLVASLQSSVDFYTRDLTLKTAIVLGSEAKGVSKAWTKEEYQSVRLPMSGIADSLNVSAAGAVLFYEALRQRART
jgi:TrmH family RNA methyltransferase